MPRSLRSLPFPSCTHPPIKILPSSNVTAPECLNTPGFPDKNPGLLPPRTAQMVSCLSVDKLEEVPSATGFKLLQNRDYHIWLCRTPELTGGTPAKLPEQVDE